MRTMSTIVYMGAVITFIGWLLYRVRQKDPPEVDAAQMRRRPSNESKSRDNGRDQETDTASGTTDPAPVGPGNVAARKSR